MLHFFYKEQERESDLKSLLVAEILCRSISYCILAYL